MDVRAIPKNLERDEEETISLISSLPSNIDLHAQELFKYQGCWYNYKTLQGVLNFQQGFEPQDTYIIIASFLKSGTTWLKALTFTHLERSKHSFDDHPLLLNNPHSLAPSFEHKMYIESSKPDLTKFSSSPRLFSTHVPFHTLRETLKNSPCKIVYMWRNVKDVFVSIVLIEKETSVLESMFESFCSGDNYYGPYWEHILSYWRGSLEDSENVLFLRYEELKTEPRVQLKRLAEFLDCPFTVGEEESGSVEEILDLCSFGNLKNLEINKTGKTVRGVGDSKNYLTPEMEKRIDMIIEEKFRDSDFKF